MFGCIWFIYSLFDGSQKQVSPRFLQRSPAPREVPARERSFEVTQMFQEKHQTSIFNSDFIWTLERKRDRNKNLAKRVCL